MKRTISVLLSALTLLLLFALPFPAAATTALDLRVTPFENAKTEIRAWFNDADGSYCLFFPADADRTAVTVGFTGGETLTVGETTLQSGDVTDVFAADTLTVTLGETDYTVKCYASANVPSVYIQTKSVTLAYLNEDKAHKDKGTITTVENGTVKLDGTALKQIKGRGNSTWGYPKKPYNIKFDKKTSLLGMPKAKKWSFLANYEDRSLMRNALAFYMADALGIPYTSDYRFADLYINGEYLGNYMVCESVEVGDNRVEISDLAADNETANPGVDLEALPQGGTGEGNTVESCDFKNSRKWVEIPHDPTNITGGYLLEVEYGYRYNDELSGFVTDGGQCVVVKAPEIASKAQVNYIADLYGRGEAALLSATGENAQGEHFSTIFDVPSLAAMYVLNEFSMEVDAGFSSNYFFKNKNSGLLICAPAWDYDSAFARTDGFRSNVQLNNASVWYANQQFYAQGWMSFFTVPTVYNLAYRHASFRSAVQEVWTQWLAADGHANLLTFFTQLQATLAPAAQMDAVRWFQNDPGADYTQSVQIISNFLQDRKTAMNKGFSDTAALLFYDGNGAANGFVNEATIFTVGDSVAVKAPDASEAPLIAKAETDVFEGWNTASDGSGTGYLPGDTITLTQDATVLYAQWKSTLPETTDPITVIEQEIEEEIEQVQQKSRTIWEKIRDFFRNIWQNIINIFKFK